MSGSGRSVRSRRWRADSTSSSWSGSKRRRSTRSTRSRGSCGTSSKWRNARKCSTSTSRSFATRRSWRSVPSSRSGRFVSATFPVVRLDALLHALCLFKTRSQANRACADGRVWLNGTIARASRSVRPGDRIRWRDPIGRVEQEVEILEVPRRQVSRAAAREMVRVLERRVIDDPWEQGG
ncbi:MAG: hypothetical protein GF346_03855 [Candidatus Eisenbacteria bacterium]|nr:hypothetical protein [Candidatus Latescibacterota bacterium]MBD3301559.1 hypothetical protein [Candidatus Eisenbacteria bacterium]